MSKEIWVSGFGGDTKSLPTRMDDKREVLRTIVDEWLEREATPGRCPDCGSAHVTEYMNGSFGDGTDYAFSSCDECEYEFDDGREVEE